MHTVKKALILDLDGTVRRSKSGKQFIEGPEDMELMPGILKLIWRYRLANYLVFGVSNQGGVAWGFKTPQQCQEETNTMMNLFDGNNPFHAIRLCMHDPRGNVEPYNHRSLHRKPEIGMLADCEVCAFNAGWIVDWDHSLFVGDRPEDEECAKRAGVTFRHIDDFLSKPSVLTIEP